MMFAVAFERSSAFSGAVVTGLQKGVVDTLGRGLGGGRGISRTWRQSKPGSCAQSLPSEIFPLM